MKKAIVAAGLITTTLTACYNDKYDKLYPPAPPTVVNTCDTTTISYAKDVAPIISTYCAINGGCHNAAGNAVTGNLDFTVLATLQSQATPNLMIADINGTPTRGHTAMPLNLSKLPDCEINKLTRWANEGAPNN